MRARPLLRSLPVAGLVIAMAGFILAPALPAQAADPTLDVDVVGGGTGTVLGVPAAPLALSTHTLIADPASNSYFAGWTVAGAGSSVINGDEVDVTLGADDTLTSVIARFERLFPCPGPFCGPFPHGLGSLSVAKNGTGTGTVTSTDGLISCGADCGQAYGALSQVTLFATPGPNSSFAGWNVAGYASNLAGCGGTGACTLQLNNWNGFGWNGVNWNGFGWNGFDWNTLVTATFNAVSPVAAASVTRVSHLHQHGGIVTGPWHHGVRHLKKHTHTHSHVAI